MTQADPAPRPGSRAPLATIAVGIWLTVLAGLVILGADLLWVVALGDHLRSFGEVPTGVPFAVAPQVDWHSPILAAEVLLSFVHGLGDSALGVLQILLVATTLTVLVSEGRRLGGSEASLVFMTSLVVIGSASAMVVVRLPSLSLVPWALAVTLMRRQYDRPSRGIWWLVPLFIVWGNLHGAVLVGLAVLGVFLIAAPHVGSLQRRGGVAAGCLLSLVVTSAGMETPAYYVRVLNNEAAARGVELWARPSLSDPLDVVMLVAAALLIVSAALRRPPLWELLATAGLLVGTAFAARNGIWLILFVAPASVRRQSGNDQRRSGNWRAAVAVTVAASVLTVGMQMGRRSQQLQPPGVGLVPLVEAVAAGRPVLADEPIAETLAQGGLKVWAANPLDAFPRAVQGQFLDFLSEGRVPVGAGIDVAVVRGETASALARQGWLVVAKAQGFVVLERIAAERQNSAL
jgi:hypothetical protein